MGAIFAARGLRADNAVNDQLGFYAMLDNKILTKRQNKVLHQLFSGIKFKPQKFISGPEKWFWNF